MTVLPSRSIGLRQADWRFLLPEPPEGSFRHIVVLGGPAELPRSLVDGNIARRVSRHSSADAPADGLVMFRDAAPPIADAARGLSPGAPFYLEVDRRTARQMSWSPSRMRRRLLEAGLTPTALYWVLPDFERAICYCPLGHPGALRWCLTSLYPATSIMRRLVRYGAELVLGFDHGRTAPPGICYVVVGRRGASVSAETPRVMLTRGHDDFTRVILLPFDAAADAPSAVVKIGRFPERNAATEAEQRVLAAVHAALPAEWHDSVPQALGLAWRGPLVVGKESCASGHLLSTAPGVRDLELVTEWLSEFHARAPVSRDMWGDAEIDRWIVAPLESYERALGITDAEAQLFAAVRALAAELRGASVPVVWEHYDLGPWNIYRDGDRIRVVDWENSTPKLPLSDLLYFVTHWSARARGIRGAEGERLNFEELYCGTGRADRIVSAARGAIDRYIERVGLDRRLYLPLLVRLWVLHAVGLVARRRIAGDAVAPRRDNPFVQFVEALARCRDTLLPARG